MSTLMAELPETKLQPMGSSNWVESPWFYVGITLAVIFTFGIRRREKLLGKWVAFAVVVVVHIAT